MEENNYLQKEEEEIHFTNEFCFFTWCDMHINIYEYCSLLAFYACNMKCEWGFMVGVCISPDIFL